MSDYVERFLASGMAALKAGLPANAEEARRCFEKVLAADDADSRQKVRAWLYLSRIEFEPARQRVCFESALVLDPGNGEARQGLAILDGRLKVEDISDSNKPSVPVVPEAEPRFSDTRRLVCARCGAKLQVQSGAHEPVCSYCGAQLQSGPQALDRPHVKEQDFFAALPTAKAHSWEYPTGRNLSCQGCGASFVLPPLQTGGVCPFCGSTHVVQGSNEELIQPDALIPFQLDRGEAKRSMHQWFDRQQFCPPDLSGHARAIELRGAFLPFWTFDLGGTMDWRALVQERRGKQSKWVPRTGVHLVYHDDLLVPASRRVAEEWSGAYADFKTDALVPYSPELLSGYAAEVYQMPLDQASLAARQIALQQAKAYEQKTSLDGRNYRDFVMNSSSMVVDSYKLVLLPLWLGGYCYRGRSFSLAVNGQTGTVAGGVPRNWFQRALNAFFRNERRH